MSFVEWKRRLLELHPSVKFVHEDGTGSGYGVAGDWTALVGPSPSSDVVGRFNALKGSVIAEGSVRLKL